MIVLEGCFFDPVTWQIVTRRPLVVPVVLVAPVVPVVPVPPVNAAATAARLPPLTMLAAANPAADRTTTPLKAARGFRIPLPFSSLPRSALRRCTSQDARRTGILREP